jgi:hypothetical protein
MKITLLHPSRGRAEQAAKTLEHWLSNASGEHEIEHILSCDEDDWQLDRYKKLFVNSRIIIGPNTCVVEATNYAAKEAAGEVLIYLSDDFKCPFHWDIHVASHFRVNDRPILLKVDDCLQRFHADVLTIPIMNRQLYDCLGYFWNPLYKSMFVDQDLYWVCSVNSWLVMAPHLQFEHLHYSVGKAPRDATYTKSDGYWKQGEEIYLQRRRAGFPIK